MIGHTNSFPILNPIATIALWSLMLLSGCSLLTGNNNTSIDNNQTQKARKLVIINQSDNVVSAIQYKPCGSQDAQYQHLTGNLRPNERLTINIYTQCADFLATNAFKKKLSQMENVNLDKLKTWNIK